MKAAKYLLIVALAAILIGWLLGYSIDFRDGAVRVYGPAGVSPYDAEAEANSPLCWGLKERYPSKDFLTRDELEERSNAAKACIDQKIDYLISRRRF